MNQATSERQQAIMARLFDERHVVVRDLAASMQVSEATIRRDLRSLAAERTVRLVHGGATLPEATDYSFQAKSTRAPQAKQIIGQLAAAMVVDDQQIFLDSGTTCFQMVSHLRTRQNLCVIAASIRVGDELQSAGADVILLGGQYRPTRMDTVGPLALNALDQLRGYTAFLGADGLGLDFGPSANDIESAHLHQKIVTDAVQSVLLVDSSKFGRPSLYRIAEWEAIDCVVTEQPPAREWIKFFEEQHIELVLPR